MIPACDFCGARADRDDDTLFLESPSQVAHICEDCVATATAVLSRKRLTLHKERATTVP